MAGLDFISQSLGSIPVAQVAFNPLDQALDLLEKFGFFQVILPFLLIFAIFYGILLRTQIFGKPEDSSQPWVKPVSSIVAFAAAFLVVGSTDVVNNINTLIPQSAFIMVIAVLLLMLLVMFGIFTPDKDDTFLKVGKAKWVVGLLIVFIFLGVIDSAFELQMPIIHQLVLALTGANPSGAPLADSTLTAMLGLLLVVGIPIAIIYWFVKSPATSSGGS